MGGGYTAEYDLGGAKKKPRRRVVRESRGVNLECTRRTRCKVCNGLVRAGNGGHEINVEFTC